MAELRNGKPFFRTAKESWYCWIYGKQTALGIKGANSEREAIQAWHLRMASLTEVKPSLPAVQFASVAIKLATIVNAFLSDAACRLKSSTVKLYADNLKVLLNEFGQADATKITHQQLSLWLAKSSGNSTTKAIRIRSCIAFFGWAAKQELITCNPVVKVAKPRTQSRADAIISPDEHTRLMAAAAPCFKPVLEVYFTLLVVVLRKPVLLLLKTLTLQIQWWC